MKQSKTFFWLRFSSTIIDLSVIYCISILLQFLIWKFTFIRLGDLYIYVFCIYFSLSYYFLKGKSPAKIFTGLKIIKTNSKALQIKNILLREVILKAGIAIIIPSYILPNLFLFWSPFITFGLTLAILLLSFVLLLIFKRSWWDYFSKTIITKQPFTQNAEKNYVFFFFTLLTVSALVLIIKPVYSNKEHFITTFYPEYPVTEEVLQYADFIKHNSKDPADYVLDLFQEYDIVVLSERYHPEYTQYDLIFKIINDKRFIENVGNIFTEIGAVNFQDTLDNYLHTSFKTEDDLNKSTAILQRNSCAIHPLWDCTNRFDFLKQVNRLNSRLPGNLKINWYFNDIAFDWETTTKENYLKGYTPLKRDRIMAIHMIDSYKNTILKQKRKKVLAIVNTNHGYGILNGKNETGIDWVDSSTTNYLLKAFPGKVANIMLNSVSYMFTPIQHGKWDAAFKTAGNPDAGFDFKDSPFGDDKWDAFFLHPASFTYKDIFTGFIFYKPITQHIKKTGFPYELENFQDTLLRRASCIDSKEAGAIKLLINLYNKNPDLIFETTAAPYAVFLNILNILLLPFCVLISYMISLIFLLKKKNK